MKPVNFDEDYAILIAKMKQRIEEPENERYLISDGVMQPDEYFSKEIRLAWILKEAYDEEDGTGGGWSYFDLYDKEGLDLSKHKTFKPIIQTSYSIHNNFIKYENLDEIDSEMTQIIKCVAIINTQKLPARNYSTTHDSDLQQSIKKYSDLLEEQLDFINPNVIIFGNTFKYYKDLLKIEDSEIVKGNVWHVSKDGKLYISAYHPVQTQTSKEDYVNDIVSVVEKWKLNAL
ncbi:hypothetical protein [Flavobacterium adhaerens]|uniref:hypothetical protein n=1 Tax=Flavobacterium adhaerens TaxID=3149043 RepID=UPI0032B4EE1C